MFINNYWCCHILSSRLEIGFLIVYFPWKKTFLVVMIATVYFYRPLCVLTLTFQPFVFTGNKEQLQRKQRNFPCLPSFDWSIPHCQYHNKLDIAYPSNCNNYLCLYIQGKTFSSLVWAISWEKVIYLSYIIHEMFKMKTYPSMILDGARMSPV